jgi:hypothetical protein
MNIFKRLFSKPEPVIETKPEPVIEKPAPVKRKPRKKKVELPVQQDIPPPKILSPKEIATKNNEPYISIVSMSINPNNITEGSFELDWNDIFIAKLIKSGYQLKRNDTDSEIVDRWFTDVARSIVLEMHEQINADPDMRDMRLISVKDIGNNRKEIS